MYCPKNLWCRFGVFVIWWQIIFAEKDTIMLKITVAHYNLLDLCLPK